MAVLVTMPRYGANMTEGTIGEWRIAQGDTVSQGDIIGEIAIEKLSNDLAAPAGGMVLKLLADEGDELPCGAAIAVIGTEGEDYSCLLENLELPRVSTGAAGNVVVKDAEAAPVLAEQNAAVPVGITPKAGSLAEELGVDTRTLKGTGRHGLITRDDVRAAASSAPAPVVETPIDAKASKAGPASQIICSSPAKPGIAVIGGDAQTVRMTPMQIAICRGMAQSASIAAPSTVTRDFDAEALVADLAERKEKFSAVGLKLSYTVYLIKALALALLKHPDFRTSVMDENHFYVTDNINIGVAVDVPGGLVVPNIKNTHEKTLVAIADELTSLAQKAKSGRLSPAEMEGGTMTLTNLGAFGIKYFTPVLNLPESAILGVGSLFKAPESLGNDFRFVSTLPLSLTVDHRVISGAPASRFLDTYCDLLRRPSELK